MKSKLKRREALLGILFILPALIFFSVFVLYPTFNTIGLSFVKWDMLSEKKFVLFDNYKHLFTDERLGKIALNTLILTVLSVSLKLILGILLAYFVFNIKNKVGKIIMETVIFLPIVLPMSVVSMVFLMLLNTDVGAINGILQIFGISKIHWLDSQFLPLISVLIIDIWKGIGFFFIISLVAMREIPYSYLEAADLDGASKMYKFRKIVLPCISSQTFFLVINALITTIQIFDPVYMVMSNGGPGDATTTMSYYIWKTGLQERNVGYGSTLAVILFGVIMLVTLIQFLLSKYWVNYDK